MANALPEDAWVNSFLPTPPRPLLTALQKRLHSSTTHLNALAEVYKQRAQIEATYAESLSKLAKTAEQGGLSGKSGNEWDKASGEARLWDSVISELAETSASHSTLSAMLRTDFEQPLREMPNKVVAWRRINEQETSLDKTLKDYEKTSSKLEKAAQKSKSSKADQLQHELNQITSSLSSLSPMVYSTFQRLDEERLRTLKEVIVRWGTVKGDIATRDGQRAESIIATLLSWETDEEVLNVGRRLGSIGGNGPRLSVPDSAATTPRSDRRMSSVTATTSQTHDFSPRPPARTNGSSTNVSRDQTGFTGGFKSMLGRTKTMAGGGSRNRSDSNATSTRSGRERDGNFETIGDGVPRIQGSTSNAPPVDDEGFSVAPTDRHRNPWEDPNELVPTPVTATGASAGHGGPATPGFGQNFTSSPNASAENLSSSASSQHQNQPRLNLSLAPAPIQESEEERQAALQKMQQTLQMPPSQPSRRGTIARGRRDVRNTMFPGSLTEDVTAGAGSSGIGGLSLNKIAEPEERMADSPTSIGSPVAINGHAQAQDRPQQARQTSMSSVTSNNPFDSPHLGTALAQPTLATSSTDPGLRANLSETINVIFKNKEVSRIQITGEIHLSLRPSVTQPTTGPIHIRLTSFEKLEKIAPNPAYLAQVPDRPGEYFLNSEVLASATANAASKPAGLGTEKGTLLFKYVVHVQPGKELRSTPLILEPAFQCKDGETRMILHYRSGETSSSLESLSNVSIAALFGPGPSVTNVQAKPAGGVWSPASRKMQWKLGQLTSNGNEGGGKIIAKFVTEPGEAMSPVNVQAAFGVEGSLLSGLGVEVVGGELEGHSWSFEEVQKGTVAGKYLAEPVIN